MENEKSRTSASGHDLTPPSAAESAEASLTIEPRSARNCFNFSGVMPGSAAITSAGATITSTLAIPEYTVR